MTRSPRRTFLAVGTSEGGYLLTSDSTRRKWARRGPFLRKESVNSFAYRPDDETLFAATLSEGVFMSDDFGRTWKPASRGLNVRKVWSVAIDPREPETLYAGTHYGHLFRSEDSGGRWEEVVGLHGAPGRKEWGIDWALGTTGLCIHTILIDQNDGRKVFIVSSGGGTYRSDDRGETWNSLQNGIQRTCPVGGTSAAPDIPINEKATVLEKHLKEVHSCTHKLALSENSPGTMYQQSHCGVYGSADSGDNWEDISPGDSVRHGFPIALIENGTQSLFVVPAFQGNCKKHNSCIKGQLAVFRRQDSKWEKLVAGLPKGVHTCVLRDGMATDGLKEPGVYFGTTTGEVFGTLDAGEHWRPMMRGAGRIQGVSSFAT
ncbi:MAG: hypothetical protein LYZ66_06060 [Nitrososphaerales archaeon]|nr:hypothetical protein [Nitrososphaerales archaeon]